MIVNGSIVIVLDDNECWFTDAFDNSQLYYSSDSAKHLLQQFLFKIIVQVFKESKKWKTLFGGTLSFINGQIRINKRQATIANKLSLNYEKEL